VSAVHDRWELVEPLLCFAHALRDPAAFRSGETKCARSKVLADVKREHHFEDAAIAQALHLLDVSAPAVMERDPEEGVPLHVALRETAERWLVADGDHWALRVEARQPGHEIIRWRGVTMLVPPSIVVGAALAGTERSHPCWVQVLPDSIAPREPVGHLHVHLGPMLPFEALWIQLWNAFLQHGSLDAPRGDGIASIKHEDVPKIGRHENKRQPGMRWQWMLELAFAARVWLLLEGEPKPPSVLRDFGRGQISLERRTTALLGLRSQPAWRERARQEARLFVQRREREDRRTFRSLSKLDAEGSGGDLAAMAPRDADDEAVFVAGALRRCQKNTDYAHVLYQYLRVKVALYSTLVVDPWTFGLRHFLDVVKRDSPYTNVIGDSRRLDEARLRAVRMEKPLTVRALEVHIRPEGWIKQPRQALGARLSHQWVLSFVRAASPKSKDAPGASGTRHWRRAREEVATMCRFLARCMAIRPSLLAELRGLSLMDWERNGPVWLFEAAFRRLIDASREVAAGHPLLHLRPLHTAFHLGEDFDHLLSGLRQIFEPFEWGLIRRGDRLGHALALGLRPEVWCEENPWVRMRPLDRILDIGFVGWAFDRLGLSLDTGHLERMRIDARDAIRRVFGDQPGGDPLERARNLWLSLPRRPPDGSPRGETRRDRLGGARALRDLVLDDRRIGRAALDLSVTVETKHDLPVLQAIHEVLHDCVARWQVAVEVNPSSNLLVAGFRSIFHQPVFHTDHLPITLNADDPLTFATTLADEYAYAWAGMVVGSGENPDQATRRLEEAARCSMRYAFTDRQARAAQKGSTRR
jgi:hypothetical protein